MNRFSLSIVTVFVSHCLMAQNQIPLISNVTTSADWPSKTLQIQYDVNDAENDALTILAEFSNDGGLSYSASSQVVFSGDIGTGIQGGTGKSVTADLSVLVLDSGDKYRVRITATDGFPLDIQSLVDQVDSNRLRSNLEFVEGIRHRTGGLSHLIEVRDSIANSFELDQLAVNQQLWTFNSYTARNIIGTNRGIEAPDNVVIVDAHFDSVSNAPGADDNGSGTVGVLEIAHILSQYPSKKSTRFIGFDLEEAGLLGSIRYTQSGIPAGDDIDAVLNFEMIGYYTEEPGTQTLPAGFNLLFPAAYDTVVNNEYRGDFITNVGNVNSSDLVDLFDASAATYVPGLKSVGLKVPGNGELVPDLRRSDHAPFWSAGIKALMLTDGANFRNECYHTPSDTLDNKLNFTFMSQVVKATLATAAALVEPLHGSMAVENVEGPSSGIPNVAACTPKIWASGQQLNLVADQCDPGVKTLRMYTLDGRLVWENSRLDNSGNAMILELPNLLSGIYMVQLAGSAGVWTGKVFLKR